MITLPTRHPVQMALGAILVAEELATKGRQLSFAALCAKAADWAVDTRDLLLETVRDAERGEFVVDNLLGDGEASVEDRRQIRGVFTEIKDQIVSWRIVA